MPQQSASVTQCHVLHNITWWGYIQCQCSLHVTPCYTMIHHVTPWYTMLHHVTPCTPCCTMLHHVTPCYTMLHHVTPWYTMLHHDTPWYTMLHHDTPWYTMIHKVTFALMWQAPGGSCPPEHRQSWESVRCGHAVQQIPWSTVSVTNHSNHKLTISRVQQTSWCLDHKLL